MKKVYLYGLFIAVLLFANINISAQGSLGLYTVSVSTTTPTMGQQVSLSANLVNTSTTDTFNALIDFELANENGIINDVNVFGEPPISGNVITLLPQQVMLLTFTITPQPAYFTPGPDIIIVWPISTAPTVDSARQALTILEATGINEPNASLFKLAVQNETLNIQLTSPEYSLQRVRIYSADGRVVHTETIVGDKTSVYIGTLPKGMYIAEVTTTNGYVKVAKFVR